MEESFLAMKPKLLSTLSSVEACKQEMALEFAVMPHRKLLRGDARNLWGWSWITAPVAAVASVVTEVSTVVADVAGDVYNQAVEIGKDVVDQVGDIVGDVKDDVVDFVGDVKDDVGDF